RAGGSSKLRRKVAGIAPRRRRHARDKATLTGKRRGVPRSVRERFDDRAPIAIRIILEESAEADEVIERNVTRVAEARRDRSAAVRVDEESRGEHRVESRSVEMP